MRQRHVIELDVPLPLSAAKLSCELMLPMADSIILATARANMAAPWIQDAELSGIQGVRYFPKITGRKAPRNFPAYLTNQTEKEDPQPQVVVAFGFLMTNCEPSSPSE